MRRNPDADPLLRRRLVEVDVRHAVRHRAGVDEHQVLDPLAGLLRGRDHDGAGTAVADEDHRAGLFPEDRDDVGDLVVGTDVRRRGPLPDPERRHRVHLVTVGAQPGGHPVPRPRTQPEPRDQHECRHADDPRNKSGPIRS